MSNEPTTWETFELFPFLGALRCSPKHHICCVEHATEALTQAARLVQHGLEAPSPTTVEHLGLVVAALELRMNGEHHNLLPAPEVGPDGSLRVDYTADVEGLCEWAYASAIRPLMSVEGHAVLADLGPVSKPAMWAAVVEMGLAVKKLERLAKG